MNPKNKILILALSASLLVASLTIIWFYQTTTTKKVVSGGKMWFLSCVTIAYDPPGDNSYSVITRYFESREYRLEINFDFQTSNNMRVVARFLYMKTDSMLHDISSIENGFVVERSANIYSIADYSSTETSDPESIGPTRIINDSIWSGNRFVGLKFEIEYLISEVKVDRHGELIDHYLEFAFNITRIGYYVSSMDDFISSISTTRIYEVFDSAYKNKLGEKIGTYTFNGQNITITREYSNFKSELTYNAGSLRIGELLLEMNITQKLSIKGNNAIELKANIFDDDNDYIKFTAYQDPYFPAVIFIVNDAQTTNPNEEYQ